MKPIEYIFEAGKIPSPFPAGISSKEEFVRNQFLEMYRANPGYFVATPSAKAYWETIGVNFNIPGKTDSEILQAWLNTKTESSPFLNFIAVK